MNSLRDNINKGDRLILKGSGSDAERTVISDGVGFGCFDFTLGTAMTVQFPDGIVRRIDSMDIERRAR